MSDKTDTSESGYSYGGDDYSLTGVDRLPAIRGDRWFATVKEMTEQDATVGALIFAVEMAMRAVPWNVENADESDEAKKWGDLLKTSMDDMTDTWPNIMADGLTFIPYGYSLFELVYKVRAGYDESDLANGSKHDDGLIGWKKWAFRPQPTKKKWVVQNGDVVAWEQKKPNSHESVSIPAEKFVVFRSSARQGMPEGVSILKRAYRAYYHKNETEVQEAIGVMRDLAGLIHIEVPSTVLNGTTAKDIRARAYYTKIIKNVKRGTQEGLLTPSDVDQNGKKQVEVKLLTSGGTRQFDTSKIVERYRTDIAMTLLADFILMGHQKVGSYSLADSKVTTFTRAISGWLDMMEEAINEQAVARLMRMNGAPMKMWPKWKHGNVAEIDLKALGDFLSKMIAAKALPATRPLAKWIAENIGTPVPTDEELDKWEEESEVPEMLKPFVGGGVPPDEDDSTKPGEKKPADDPLKATGGDASE